MIELSESSATYTALYLHNITGAIFFSLSTNGGHKMTPVGFLRSRVGQTLSLVNPYISIEAQSLHSTG